MSETIIVAIIALVGTLGGSWLGVRQANKLTCYRIEQLEIKVNKHNNLIERMMAVEKSAELAHKRIDEIREVI